MTHPANLRSYRCAPRDDKPGTHEGRFAVVLPRISAFAGVVRCCILLLFL